MAEKIKASQQVSAGQSFMSLRATPAGWLDNIDVLTVNNDQIALCNQTVKAVAIDPSSDFDCALITFVSPQSIIAGSLFATGRVISIGSPLVGQILADESLTTLDSGGLPFPAPVGGQIGISPHAGQFGSLPPMRSYSFIDPNILAAFVSIGSALPQLIVNCYFVDPPTLPTSRPHKNLTVDQAGVAHSVNVPIAFPFFGRSRLSLSVQNNGALTTNVTVRVLGVFFGGAFPATARTILLTSGVVVSPVGDLTIALNNVFADAIIVEFNGTGLDHINYAGYVADAGPP